jgi:hypothetical protein
MERIAMGLYYLDDLVAGRHFRGSHRLRIEVDRIKPFAAEFDVEVAARSRTREGAHDDTESERRGRPDFRRQPRGSASANRPVRLTMNPVNQRKKL